MTSIAKPSGSAFQINRRQVGFLALGAALSACGGGGDDQQALGRIAASDWSETLPVFSPTSPVQLGYIAVGAGGLVYATSLQGSDVVLSLEDGHDGTRTFRLRVLQG